MKILTVCSGLDFINYTRRATIEAIQKLNPDLEILMFNSVLNLRKKKLYPIHIKFHFYHFWIVEKLRKATFLVFLEHKIRSLKWKCFFKRFDLIFLIDPNQYYLLPFINQNQKVIYLLRDPSILLDPNNFNRELLIIKRANLILGISQNLCDYYFRKYYNSVPDNIKLWSNTVDLGLWDYIKLAPYIKQKTRPVVGLAGNIDFVIDIELLIFVAKNLPEYDFEIAGKLDLDKDEEVLWSKLLKFPNIRYLSFIPYDDFPKIVINWAIGLVAAKPEHEYARYLNNNKQYQYIALGKPFVSYHLNSDYGVFGDLVFIAKDKFDFVNKIRMAIDKSFDINIINRGIDIASQQSSEARAKQFLDIVKKL